MEVVCGGESFTVLAPHVQKYLGHSGVKVIKGRETRPWEGNAEKTEVADTLKAVHSKPLGVPVETR